MMKARIELTDINADCDQSFIELFLRMRNQTVELKCGYGDGGFFSPSTVVSLNKQQAIELHKALGVYIEEIE